MKVDLRKQSVTLDEGVALLTPDNRTFLEIHIPTNHLLSINQPGPLVSQLLRKHSQTITTTPKEIHPFTPDQWGGCTQCPKPAPSDYIYEGEIED